ncbi:MAG: DNA-directed RNA polymerase subunit alpha [Candidatus Kapabacteria bacterium]|nr:DNA-directed RNA polymerase subunit alpha [Candidatus Kapabacteria bacterium]
MPEKIQTEEVAGPYHARFVLNPLEEGYGVTIGNAFRRVLLSSIQGVAITGVKITDVQHEFQTIPGVTEDMCEIILNLKEVRLRLVDKKAQMRVYFRKKGPGIWTAKDIQDANPGIEVLDPDKKIATLANDADFDVELRLGRGKGYVPSEEQNTTEFPVGMIAIDSIFTPIKNVIFKVEPFRVGQKTDYEKLTLDVQTDGSITAADGVQHAAEILNEHIALFLGARRVESDGSIAVASTAGRADDESDKERARIRRILTQPVDELELSVRAHNCLKAASIKTLADLVSLQESDLLKFRNFGRKSLSELTEVVYQNGLQFGMDVEPYLREDKVGE